MQKAPEIERLAQKYPRLSKKLIRRHLAREEPRVGRTPTQKEYLLKVVGMFEGPGDLSDKLDEHLHQSSSSGKA